MKVRFTVVVVVGVFIVGWRRWYKVGNFFGVETSQLGRDRTADPANRRGKREEGEGNT